MFTYSKKIRHRVKTPCEPFKHSNWYANMDGYYCKTCQSQHGYLVDTKTKEKVDWL